MAGHRVKCPACGESFTVPKAVAKRSSALGLDAGELLDEVGFAKSVGAEICPECHAEFEEEALICVNCGYHREAGKRVKVVRNVAPEDDMNLPPQLRHAMKQVRHEKIEKYAEAGEGYTSWILSFVLFGGVGAIMAAGILYVTMMGGCR